MANAVTSLSDLQQKQLFAADLERQGRSQEALAALEDVAQSYAAQGELLRAIAVCRALVRLDPSHVRSQALLAERYARRDVASAPSSTLVSSAVSRSVTGEFDLATSDEPAALFSRLPHPAFVALVDAFEPRSFGPLARILKEGDPGSAMFALVEGSVNVVRQAEGDTRVVAQLGPGELFGEVALMAQTPRLASVVAAERCTLLELSRERMDAVTAKHPVVKEVLQTFYRERLLSNVLRESPLFSDLAPAHKTEVARAFTLRTVAMGEELVRHGVLGDTLFVLLRGRCLPFHPRPDGGETKYPAMSEGDIFGEISLLLGKPATATVRALTPCTLLCLSRPDLERLVLSEPAIRSRLMQMSFERLQRSAQLLSGRFV